MRARPGCRCCRWRARSYGRRTPSSPVRRRRGPTLRPARQPPPMQLSPRAALRRHGRSQASRPLLLGPDHLEIWVRPQYRHGSPRRRDFVSRSGRPAIHDETSIIAVTLEPPPTTLGVTHWSARLLADHLDISFATVARIWRRWGLQPWKAETFKFPAVPELEAKIRDVVGLYLDPPTKAVVVCIDEKT